MRGHVSHVSSNIDDTYSVYAYNKLLHRKFFVGKNTFYRKTEYIFVLYKCEMIDVV